MPKRGENGAGMLKGGGQEVAQPVVTGDGDGGNHRSLVVRNDEMVVGYLVVLNSNVFLVVLNSKITCPNAL